MKNLFTFCSLSFWGISVIFSSCTNYTVSNEKLTSDTTFMTPVKTVINEETTETETCTTENIKWRPGSAESILLDPQSSVIYPGSVVEASSIQDGKFTPLTGSRKPITISISITNSCYA